MEDIRTLIQQNVPHSQIHTLGLGLRQYQRFAKIINLKNQEIWRELVKGELVSKLRSSYDYTYQTALVLSKTPGLDTTDILLCLAKKDQALLDILKLMVEGTELLSDQHKSLMKYHRVGQSKLAMQPHP